MSSRAGWMGLPQVGVVAIILITAQTLVLHGATGRQTPTLMALSWSVATVGAWGIALLPALSALPRWAAHIRAHRLSGALTAMLGMLLVIVIAGMLRAAVDPWLPTSAPVEWIAERSFMIRTRDYALRWLGPGTLFCLLLLALRLRAGAPAPAVPEATEPAPSASASPEPASPEPVTSRLIANPDAPLPHITVRVGEREVVVPTATIAWCEADGNYVRLHLAGKPADHRPLVARITLAQLTTMLDARRFVRVHRSIVVAVDEVVELRSPRDRGATVLLRSGAIAPVSRDGRRLLRDRLGPVS
ncbi:MAG TPA: LytTR family transcriptional regulator DNA-binding domain-containing protein [Gemmatimonas sp.]|uniref:LytR/AlgR family response regulator transcription factor n=1 Tax=Gemmatimonas sp. TaxID=1962908 RepID=UPI002ED835B5